MGMQSALWATALALTVSMLSPVAQGAHLGVIGPVYSIAEEDMLAMIERRLRERQASGELAALREQAVARGKRAVTDPAPLPLLAARTARTHYIDPSFVLDRDVKDASGVLLFAAGTRANPLDIVPMARRMLFFDARDARQVALAARLMGKYAGGVKPVLTGGSHLELTRSWRMPVYYDQQGLLTRRLSVASVPALVSQEGQRLRVDELVPEDGGRSGEAK